MHWLSEVCPLHSSFQHSGWPHAFAQDILWTGLSETSLHIHHPRPKLKSIHTLDARAGIGNGTLRMKCVEIVPKSVISPWWKATSALSQLCKMLVPPLRTCCRRGLDCWWCDHVWLMNSLFVNLKLLQKPKAYFFGLFKKALLQCVCQPAERSLTAQTIAINHRCVYWIRCWSTTAQIRSVLGFLVKACQSWISQALAMLVLFRKKYSSCNFSPCLGPVGRGSFISQRGGLSRKMDSMSQRKAGVHLQNRFHLLPLPSIIPINPSLPQAIGGDSPMRSTSRLVWTSFSIVVSVKTLMSAGWYLYFHLSRQLMSWLRCGRQRFQGSVVIASVKTVKAAAQLIYHDLPNNNWDILIIYIYNITYMIFNISYIYISYIYISYIYNII